MEAIRKDVTSALSFRGHAVQDPIYTAMARTQVPFTGFESQ